jgi:hypothetical protein
VGVTGQTAVISLSIHQTIMVIGLGFAAKRCVGWSARQLGCSDETSSRLGNATKWAVALTTLDVGSILFDSALESGVESVGDGLLESASDGGAERAATARGTYIHTYFFLG